jgi:hypothetical protein
MEIGFWLAKVFAQWAILAILVIVALWRGKGPERVCASTFVAMFVLDQLYHLMFPSGPVVEPVNVGHLVIDIAAAASFGVVALFANRIYPICLAGLQLAAVTSHFLRFLAPSINGQTYGILISAPSYLQTLAFGLGLALHLRRQARSGRYPSWRGFSAP